MVRNFSIVVGEEKEWCSRKTGKRRPFAIQGLGFSKSRRQNSRWSSLAADREYCSRFLCLQESRLLSLMMSLSGLWTSKNLSVNLSWVVWKCTWQVVFGGSEELYEYVVEGFLLSNLLLRFLRIAEHDLRVLEMRGLVDRDTIAISARSRVNWDVFIWFSGGGVGSRHHFSVSGWESRSDSCTPCTSRWELCLFGEASLQRKECWPLSQLLQ